MKLKREIESIIASGYLNHLAVVDSANKILTLIDEEKKKAYEKGWHKGFKEADRGAQSD